MSKMKPESLQESSKSLESNKTSNKTVYVVFVSLVIDLLAFTVILPLIPSHLDYYSKHDSGGLYPWLEKKVQIFQKLVGAPDDFNKVLFGGLIGSLFSFLQYLSSPIMGAMSDVYGRKPVLIISTISISFSYVIWALSQNFTIFVIARIIGGISKGNIGLSAAVVTDVSTEKTRGRGMALIGVAFSIGFIIGPMIGAGFAAWGKNKEGAFFVPPALFAFTLAVIDVIFITLFLKESLPVSNRASSIANSVTQATQFINPVSLFSFAPVENDNALGKRQMKRIGSIYFLYLFLYSGLEYSLTFLTHLRFNYTSMQQGKMYLFSGLIMACVQGGYVRRIKPGSESRIALRGFMVIIPSFIVIGLAHNTVTLYIGLAMYAFASATVVPCLTTLVSTFGNSDQKGTILGIFRSLGALARALGPLIASAGFWCMGPSLCYCIGGALLLLPYLQMRNFKRELESNKNS